MKSRITFDHCFKEIISSPDKYIRMHQIRAACNRIARGENVVIPPPWNPSKNGNCDGHVPRSWTPEKLHGMKLEKLQGICQTHCGIKGPTTYKTMFIKLRQHLCFYHGWKPYDVPETRIKPPSKLKRKRTSSGKKSKKNRHNA